MAVGIPITLQDGKGTGRIAHLHKRNGDTGIVAFTEDLRERKQRFDFAVNPNIGVEMALDGSFGGTPVGVHNGIDSTLWTGSSIVGNKYTFNSTTQFNSGAASVEINNSSIGHVMEFDKGSDIDLSNYVGITMFVYVTSGWTGGSGDSISMYGWDTATGLQVGTEVLIENFINEVQFGVWQKVSISLDEMDLTTSTIDAIRFETLAKSGAGPLWYIDDFQIEETGGAVEFEIKPPLGTKLDIDEINLTFIDAYDSRLADSSMTNLSYDKFLAVSKLANGINITVTVGGEVAFSAIATCIADFFRAGSMITNMASDGTNTVITVSTRFEKPIILDSRISDKVTVTISDDLSGLISLFTSTKGSVRDI